MHMNESDERIRTICRLVGVHAHVQFPRCTSCCSVGAGQEQAGAQQQSNSHQRVRELSSVIHMRWWEPVGRHSLPRQTRKWRFFNQTFEAQITFLAISPQPRVEPAHKLYHYTLLILLYQVIYVIQTHHRLYPTETKSTKTEFSLYGAVRRVSTHVYARCMAEGCLLILSLACESVSLWC